jgi:formate dehydrogenase beta subunit
MSDIVFSSWGGQVVDNRSGQSVAATAADIKLPLNYGSQHIAAFMSWDGLVITDKNVSVVALASAYMREAAKLACGECSMGYKGTAIISETLSRIAGGQGKPEDVELLVELADSIQKNVRCDFCANAVIPLRDALKNYREAFVSAAGSNVVLPQIDYITKITAPCQEACPIHQDVPGYLELIRNRRNTEALEVIRRTNCLPRVTGRTCVAFCEKNCVRKDIDSPLSVRALKRVPADLGIIKPLPSEKGAKKDKVAIIGAGPAGLSAAQYLSLKGYQVYIFDEQAASGGMTFAGIPAYRLPRNILAGEVETIAAQGVQIRLNTRIRHAEELRRTFKAVLIASGAHQTRESDIDNWNKDYDGLMEGVKFLHEVSSGKAITPRQRVLVVGGGNTAIDCARTVLRLGCKEAMVVYRRSRHEMPARDEEVKAAEEEGVKFQFLAVSVKIQSQNNKVVGAECIRMELGEPDASGRRKPLPLKGSEFVLPADMVLTAIGEIPDLSFLPQGKVDVTSWNSIKTDENGNTSIPWLFAAGDCASGPASIVEAMAAGKRAAESLHLYMSKNKLERPEVESIDRAFHEIGLSRKRRGPKPAVTARKYPHEMNAEDRSKSFDEVEECFNVQVAAREAERCLRCYRVMLIVKRQG